MVPKAFLSWSSGKDSAFALIEARRLGLVEIVGILTTISETYDRVVMHGVRHSVLDLQIVSLGLPCIKVSLPLDCSMDEYEQRMDQALTQVRNAGVHQVVYGDLYLESVRSSREAQLARLGMYGVFPLWNRSTTALAHEMIACGIVADIVCVDPRRLDRRFSGRRFDHEFLAYLPSNVDPCGENGEFHTVVSNGPMFRELVRLNIGEVVEGGGFVFADAFESDRP